MAKRTQQQTLKAVGMIALALLCLAAAIYVFFFWK